MGFKSEAVLWTTSLLTVAAIGVGGVLGVEALGMPLWIKPYEAPVVVEPVSLEWSTTPAYEAIVSTLNVPYPEWVARGPIEQLAPSALPASCVGGLLGPSGSMSRTFDTPAGGAEVTLTAYSAGLGAGAYDALIAAVDGCGAAKSSSAVALGTQSTMLTTQPAGVATSTLAWRRGDLVAFVSLAGDPAGVATMVDTELNNFITPICVDQSSVPASSVRNPWVERAAFTGLLENREVAIPEPALPALPVAATPTPVPTTPGADPVDPTSPVPVDPNAPTPVVVTPIPAPELPLAEVTRPRKPTYPVWPLLPTALSAPTMPKLPTAPTLASVIAVTVQDVNGPGCGWAFAGTFPPIFDEKAAADKEAADRAAATLVLEADVDRWESEVLGYWNAYATYSDQVRAFNAYAAEVANTKLAWDVIAAQWAIYNRDLQAYQVTVTARDKFLANQAAAQSQFDADTLACQAPVPVPTPEPTPTPTPTSDPSADPTPPVEEVEPPVIVAPTPPPCPTRPAILDEQAPALGTAPTPPPDPRPVS